MSPSEFPGDRSVLVAGHDAEHSLGRACARGFEALGCDVEYVDTGTRTIPFLGLSIGVEKMHDRFVSAVQETDPFLVLVIKGESLPPAVLERARDQTTAYFANWNPDNPFMARSEPRKLGTYLRSLSQYDVVFIWTEELFDQLTEAGARAVRHLSFAYDPSIHQPVEPAESLASDVVFAGHWSEKRQRHLAAVAKLDVDLAIYGNYWKRKCFDRSLRKCVRDSAVFGEEYSKVHCSSKIAINIVADHNLNAYNMRTFEIPATGSFMATSRTEKQEELLGENEGMVCFESPEELSEKVAEYLDDGRRAEIAKKGAEHIRPHTYENRMETVVEAVQEVQ